MNFKAHFTLSIVSAAGLTGIAYTLDTGLSEQDIMLIAPMVIFGGIFPDTDTKSIPSKWYAIIMCLSLPAFFYYDMPWHWIAILIPYMAAKIFPHRNWTHSGFLVLALISSSSITEVLFILAPVPEKWNWIKEFVLNFNTQIIFFAVGIGIHILLDLKLFKRFGR